MPIFLGAVWASFSRFAMTRAGSWVVGLMLFLGLSLTTHTVLVDPIVDMIRSSISGLPQSVTAWAGAFGIDKVLTMLFSAYAARSVKGAIKVVKR